MTASPAAEPLVRRAFPGATCGADVVPGAPDRLAQIADQLGAISTGLLRLAMTMQRVQAVDWHGVASLAFGQLVSTQSRPVARAGALMAQAAEHVSHHARVLASAQREADHAVWIDLRAAAATSVWSTSGAAGPDPGDSARRQAQVTVTTARDRVRRSGREAAAGLRAAADLAPSDPGWLRRQGQRWDEAERQLRIGALQGVAGMAQFVMTFNSVRMLTDPEGYGQDLAGLTTQTLAHPGSTLRGVLDVETWNDSKARWLGHLAPAAGLGLVTGGASVAVRAPSATARLLAAGPGARAALVRRAILERPQHLRSALRARDVRSFASAPSEYGTVVRLGPTEHSVAAAMARDAEWAQSRISPQIDLAAERLAARRVGNDHELKEPESLSRKVAEQLGQPGSRLEEVSARVNDGLRYTLVYPDDVYVERASATVEQLRAQGFDLATVKSFWGGPRYQGVNLTFHDPGTGRLFEVQLHTPDSWDTTVRTHPDYARYRDVGVDPLLKRVLERRIGVEFAKVPRPAGVSELDRQLSALGLDVAPLTTTPLLLAADPRVLGRHLMGASGAGAAADSSGR